MRKLIQISFLIIMFSCCSRNNPEINTPPIRVKAEILRIFDSTYNFGNKTSILNTINLKLSVTNVSDKPLDYFFMNCTWSDNFVSNKENYFINQPIECAHNSPEGYHLKPRQSKLYNLFLNKADYNTMNMNDNNLKIGFIFIDSTSLAKTKDSNSFVRLNNILGDRSLQNIIWSNPINLK